MGGLVEKLHPIIEKSIIFEKPHLPNDAHLLTIKT